MPAIEHLLAIGKDLRESKVFPQEVVDLIHARDEHTLDVLHAHWKALASSIGAVELAFRRGYELGLEDGKISNG